MSRLTKFFTRAEKSSAPVEVEHKSVVLGTSESMGSFLMFGNDGNAGTAASALRLYDKSTAVSIPINRIASAIAALSIVIKLEDGTVINRHPVLDLLRKPSPHYSSTLFLETIAKNFLITGETQTVAIGGIARPPIELQPISPSNITVPEGSNGLPTSIIIAGNTLAGQYTPIRKGNSVRYIRDNLTEIHMTRNFKTRNNSLIRGESLLKSASSEVRQHILGGEHNASLLERGGRVSLIFHFKESMSDDDFQVAKKRVRAQYGGPKNAGEIAVTAGDEGLDIKEIGVNNKDMDFAKLQQTARTAVANQYSFPLVLLDTDAATFNNYEAAKEALYDDAALPVANILLGAMSDFLFPRYGEDPSKMRLIPDIDSIPALAMRRNKELKLRREIGVETHNELRDMLPNREDITGGDQVLIPANMVPLNFDPSENELNPGLDDDGE